MSNLNLLNFKFENTFELSQKAISYIESLNILKEIDVFLEIPDKAYDGDIGWAFVEDRRVYIRPTNDVENFEISLVHELTHISNHDEGYPDLLCEYNDSLGTAFGNLLHHLIIYSKMKEYGFSMETDSKLVMRNIEDNLQGFRDLCSENNRDAKAYTVIVIINNLIRLEGEEKKEYISLANKYIPYYLNKAKAIKADVLPNEVRLFNVEWYKRCKEFIETQLGIETFKFSH